MALWLSADIERAVEGGHGVGVPPVAGRPHSQFRWSKVFEEDALLPGEIENIKLELGASGGPLVARQTEENTGSQLLHLSERHTL